MKPAARIQTCIEVLDIAARSKVPLDGTIGDYMRRRRYIGAKDRANIVERLYSIVRSHARLGWWLQKNSAEDTPRHRVLAWILLGEKMDKDAITNLFDGSKYAPASLTEDEKSLCDALQAQALDDDAMPISVRVECPAVYEQGLQHYFGDDFEIEMRAMQQSAPLDLRINTRKTSRDKTQELLAKDKVKTAPTPFSPWGLRVDGKVFLSKTRAFVKGWVDIQDEGSQMIALACGAEPGKQVLDYCAGAGGKTLALAAAMNNKGRIVAMDTDARRLEKGRQRFKRAGVSDIIEVRSLSEEKNRKWLRRQKDSFDIVLADVPCSGTGTWRRNPDTRWRTFGPSLDELLAVQADILERTAKVVKPGGRLIYATCSLLPAENERQVQAFLEKHTDFSYGSLSSGVPGEGGVMRLTPHRHNTDGFFAAILQKRQEKS